MMMMATDIDPLQLQYVCFAVCGRESRMWWYHPKETFGSWEELWMAV